MILYRTKKKSPVIIAYFSTAENCGKAINLTHEHKMPVISSVGEIREKRADEVSVGETLACMDDRGSM